MLPPTLAPARPARNGRPTVVLVHGEWADASSWNDVIARLQAQGLRVVAVQNHLDSLRDDCASVGRAIARECRPVVLVGHSWGGTVITEAGVDDKVAALVYVAAFAPDLGESTNDLQRDVRPRGHAALLETDAAGYLWFPQEALPYWFAHDLPSPNASVLAATQNPIKAEAFDDRVGEAAWHAKPSWYLVTTADRIIDPGLQRAMAVRMNGIVRTVACSHVPFIARPKETVAIILEAVAGVTAT